ncbi:MAG: Zn-dependent hydrolase [Gammaproteobacteria bacterium]
MAAPDSPLSDLRINSQRLDNRLRQLAQIGAIDGGGVCRLALSDEDRDGRNLVREWMRELGLEISVDRIGNVIGIRPGLEAGPPVMTGSHIDTVATGGRYDGNLGVLAGLEVIECLNEAGITTLHPIGVGFFTNEEGARFAPDMMGSGVHQGAMDLEEILSVTGIDGTTVGEELSRIGYAGETEVGSFRARCFIELHVEQGPVLERKGLEIGAVTGVQGISWTEYTLNGVSNHAGTTPMDYRNDPGYVAARISVEARRLTGDIGHGQVATVGQIKLSPNLVNVIPRQAVLTVDLRNMDEQKLQQAEQQLDEFIDRVADEEGVQVSRRKLARFEPVHFDEGMIQRVFSTAETLGLSCQRMPSGAGHDAQMFAPNCPTAMIFVPSKDGISHNVREYTAPEQIAAGANVLLQVIQQLAQSGDH